MLNNLTSKYAPNRNKRLHAPRIDKVVLTCSSKPPDSVAASCQLRLYCGGAGLVEMTSNSIGKTSFAAKVAGLTRWPGIVKVVDQ